MDNNNFSSLPLFPKGCDLLLFCPLGRKTKLPFSHRSLIREIREIRAKKYIKCSRTLCLPRLPRSSSRWYWGVLRVLERSPAERDKRARDNKSVTILKIRVPLYLKSFTFNLELK